ncbi:ClpXP protease specificity-enhancing factor [Gallibacterium genomosp. 3]|uniref:Starvation protein B n=1 Tax=Gallibacterium genomosp. 3 TaxID=505345 RepID=A0A1A7QAL3_9PAST|nr:ClpXP protease specificity-enhancing factor [Gallibacterium genomosp. 3]OBX11229.1 starvation protein B [Gallibacterium genomosp. 3]
MAITIQTPKRPYLLRAYFDWLVDNDLTPYLVVDANYPEVEVPVEYVRDGQIVLNLSPNAVGNLSLGNEKILFSARFQGVIRHIVIPLGAAMAIYARENGDGVMFEPEDAYDIEQLDTEQPIGFQDVVDTPKKAKSEQEKAKNLAKKTPHLRILD